MDKPTFDISKWHLAQEFVSSYASMPLPQIDSSRVLPTPMSYFDDQITTCSSTEFDFFQNIQELPTICCTKQGSIKTQHLLQKASPERIDQLVDTFLPVIELLIKDNFANYCVSSLFQSCSSQKRLMILRTIQANLLSLSCHPRATHVLQRLISLCSLQEEEAIYQQEFEGKVLQLSFHANGSYIIQKLLISIRNKQFIFRELAGSAKLLAVDKIGLCVIKKAITDPQISAEILEDLLVLMQDPYGNYAVQQLVQVWKEDCAHSFRVAMHGKVAQLSIQKYSSNVIEECLKIQGCRAFIAEEISNEQEMKLLLTNSYGCYVLRTVCRLADVNQKYLLKEGMKKAIDSLSPKQYNQKWQEIAQYLTQQMGIQDV